jgi:hypothetical protein
MRIASIAALAIAAALTSPLVPAQQAPLRVTIAPVEVAFDRDWLADMNRDRGRASALGEADARRIASDLAGDLHKALDAAIRARGIEIQAAPSSDALRLAVRIDDLYVTAPDVPSPGIRRTYVREAGRATLRAEGRDAAGALRVQHERRGTAGDHLRLERASDVTNRFWFDALFRNWAGDVAAELARNDPR